MERSFQLIRTNPRLTTNIKLVVDSKYNLYFESFNSSGELSNDKYKHYILNRDSVLEDEIPNFYSNLPKNIAFTPKLNVDADVMYSEFVQQFDNTYYSGGNEIEDQWYKEEFEYFAPLYIKKNEIPENFIILRVDDPVIYEQVGDDFKLGNLNKDNFRKEIINKWKCVTVFDLTDNTKFGKFIDRSINNNVRFPDFAFFFDVKNYNYSKWSGLNYNTGVYSSVDMFLDDKLYYSNGHFNLEEFITNGFEENSIIYPYILNIKFLFDDVVGNPNEIKKWSSNRYFGFYADKLHLVKNVTSAELRPLNTNLRIRNNIFLDGTTYVNPFLDGNNSNGWVKVGDDFYEIRLQENGAYKIISDKNLTDYNISTFNDSIQIRYENGKNVVVGLNDIDPYKDVDGFSKDMFADIYLIKILDKYHILKKDNDKYYISSDYAIISNNRIVRYWKGGENSEYSSVRNIFNDDGSPVYYSIYRADLLDIKDFDFDRINTKYSDFDYEKSEYYDTPEVKLYAHEYRDTSIPMRLKTHDKGEDGQYKLMNISSEYSACDETFELRGGKLTPMFDKNQTICKWGYSGSISHSDYAYKLNNNYKCGGVYNRTTNVDLKIANDKEKNLDYFYRIGEFYSSGDTINLVYYFNQSTNIQTGLHKKYDNLEHIGFNLEYYIKSEFDYFDFFFKNNMIYQDGGKLLEKPYIKYSIFSGGDNELPSSTLFKGVEYKLFDVEDYVLEQSGKIRNIITRGGNRFNGYKFSVILSEVYDNNLFYYDDINEVYVHTGRTETTNLSISNSIYLENSSVDGIHIIVNDKFKNILIIINKVIPINSEWISLNNIDKFGENFGLYHGKTLDGYNILPTGVTDIIEYNPDDLTASNFMESINNLNNKTVYDTYVSYYLIDKDGNFAKTEMVNFNTGENSFNKIVGWGNKYPNFYLRTESPNELRLKPKSYEVNPLRGPVQNIYDKYLVYSDGFPLNQSYIDQPLAREINKYEKDDTRSRVLHGEIPRNFLTIKRFVGYYDVIFKNLNIFKPTYYWREDDQLKSIEGNYSFNDELEQFGVVEELMYSKVNEFNNYLKLRDNDNDKSYYPMVDEVGLSQTKRFIFLSSWDSEFYLRTINEQTFLENFVVVPQLVLPAITSGEIITSSVLGDFEYVSSFTQGMRMRGFNKAGTNKKKLNLNVTIRNTTIVESKSFKIKLFYNSNLGDSEIAETIVNNLGSGAITTVSFVVNKPSENNNASTEYTDWVIKYTLLDINNNFLQSRAEDRIRIHNDLVNLSISNPFVSGSNPRLIGTSYNFSSNITNTSNLPSARINYLISIDRYNSGSWVAYNQQINIPPTPGLIPITLNEFQLDWPKEVSGSKLVTFSAFHTYEIEGINQFTPTVSTTTSINILGLPNPPILTWDTSPSARVLQGTCNTTNGVYSGDKLEIGFTNPLRIKNTGGTFIGNITITSVLQENQFQVGFSNTGFVHTQTLTNITIPGGGGIFNLNGYTVPTSNVDFYMRQSTRYRVEISSSQVSGIIYSPNDVYGIHPETYFCTAIFNPDDNINPDDVFINCLDENTLILMDDGNKKPVKNLTLGDKVTSYRINNMTEFNISINWSDNKLNGDFDISTVKYIKKVETKGYYIINDTIKVTPHHIVLLRTENGIWKWGAVKDLKLTDKLFKEDGTIFNIISIKYINAYITVYKLDVEETDNYFAGGVLNHNTEVKF